MSARLEHLGNYAAFIFNNTQQKPYSSPENPDILVNESTVYYFGRKSHPAPRTYKKNIPLCHTKMLLI